MNKNRNTKKVSEHQGSLPFSRNTRSGILAYANVFERRTVVVFGVAFLLLSVLYIYFMISSVVHVAARQELVRSASRASAEVATLETAYLSKTQTITEPYARSLGFVSVRDRSFVSKASVAFKDAR
ncbi:MAG: hypothetical protein KBC74_00630 [Candidatus Pacebacteria bacterium]|nr:hypothetical protein [Candidatus Paceibacterota bacterium]